jgi:protein TonB
MYANGFLEQKRRSPAGLATVIALHGAAIGALIMFGTTVFKREAESRLVAINITAPVIPPEVPPPPPSPQTPQQLSTPTVTPQIVTPVVPTIVSQVTPPTVYQPPLTPPGPRIEIASAATPVIPPPIRHAAEVDPRYRDALQPPYPREQEAAQRTGSVRVRITIGTDGRVTGIEQLFATNDSFWRVTQRQALGRWRFRPATVDGRPVVSTMLMTVTFRIPDA